MKVLVVGGGAREDALSWRLAASPSCASVAACPGNAGTASRGENWADLRVTDGKAIAARARERSIDLAVIGPETAIAAGVTDHLRAAGIATFGPSRSAGRLESSKVFAKRFMARHGIPTPRARIVHSLEAARGALEDWQGGCVVKADGLAAGKGVVVFDNAAAASALLDDWFGAKGVPGGGQVVLLEERLAGREMSVFAIGNGRTLNVFAGACDYKRAGDGDTGPNTGGMGAYAPPEGFPGDALDIVAERIVAPVLRGLQAEREPYVGVLYCGLMWTAKGPMVIEFNVRFGDPEAQVLVPRVDGDFARALHDAATGAAGGSLAMSPGACVGVVVATAGYPAVSTPLRGLAPPAGVPAGVQIFWGPSTLREGLVDAAGGRVLTVCARGDTVPDARAAAYAEVERTVARFGNDRPLAYRRDIALDRIPEQT
jgi:phosphoribosylamine--glycine ligase